LVKINAVIELAQREQMSPLQDKVLEHLEAHPDEVYGYRDEVLAAELVSKPSAVGFTLWALHKRSLIDKQEVGGKVYFGSHEAIARLRSGLGLPAEDAFERATRNLQRIRESVGAVDVGALLDEVRQGG
jgi:hypothetical protein